MARHKSAVKRHRQSLKRKARNQRVKSHLRTLVKRVRTAIEGKTPEEAEARLKEATRTLDKAVTKGVLHRNNAARKVSRLTAQVRRLAKPAEAK